MTIAGACGATVLGCAGAVLAPDEAAFFRDADPWGFILFARNVEDPAQLRRLTGALREAVGRQALVLVDQEGGRVARLRPPHWRDWPAPLDACALPDAPAYFHLRGRAMAQELLAVGIDANCAPCLDIARDDTHPFLRNRCLGHDAAQVARNGRALADGLLAGGVLPVMKHIPGHGRGVADSHHDLPATDAGAHDLAATDFAPFAALSDLPMAMTAHMVYRALDDRPATTSPAMIALIRGQLGFKGLLLTDDLSMNALPGDLSARTAAAMAAGCDVALHCNADPAEMRAVVAQAGRLTPAAQARAAAALARRHPPAPVDMAALEADLAAFERGTADGR